MTFAEFKPHAEAFCEWYLDINHPFAPPHERMAMRAIFLYLVAEIFRLNPEKLSRLTPEDLKADLAAMYAEAETGSRTVH